MLFVGGFVIGVILFSVDLHTPALLMLLIAAVAQSIPRRYVIGYGEAAKRHGYTREGDEAYLHQVAKEIGVEAYSPAELRQMEAEERETHNRNHASITFWGGGNEYKDYDGNWRDVATNRIVRLGAERTRS